MFEIILISICLLLNALLAAVEMAFVTVGRPALRELARNGNLQAKSILKLRESPERTLSIIQVGITLVGVLAAAASGAGATEFLQPFFESSFGLSENVSEILSIFAVVIPVTYLSVVIGELVPKTLALRHPLNITLKAAKWLVISDKIFSPIVGTLEWSTKKFLKVFFFRSNAEIQADEESTVELDVLSIQARQYVINLVQLERKKVAEIFLPWNQVVFVDSGQTFEEVESISLKSGHTRIPVLKGKEVIGIINTKELFALRKIGSDSWDSIIRPAVVISDSAPLLKALKKMQDKRSHLGVVFSNDHLKGIITIEDVFEEIVGDIFDEDDDGKLRKILSSKASIKIKR